MIVAPRWRKVFRDIADTPARTGLAVLAMAAGVFGLGTILTSYSILRRELAATYAATRPASAILSVDRVDDSLVTAVRRAPGVLEAEARPFIGARVRVSGDEWAPLLLFVVRDFGDIRIDRFTRDTGAWPPADDEVLVERSALSVARAAVGDRITMRTADGLERSLRIAGTVHAAGLPPGWMDHVVTGFVTWRSIARADPKAEGERVRMIVRENGLDEWHIRTVAAGVKASLEREGAKVSRIEVPTPGRHPHADQMDTFLFLLGCFGALTFVLSAVLVANMIHALLTEQIRQVGVMKAVGATTSQVASLYLGQVSILAAISLAIGMPLAFMAGRGYARFAATILNADLATMSVPVWIVILQIALGVVIPLVVAFGPVYGASRITIHQAFSNGVDRRPFGVRRFDRWLARIQWLPRPLMLSLRTAFHRRGRLALTIGTLAAGGAVFISALNVSAEWSRLLAVDARSRRYDIDVRFLRQYPIAALDKVVATLPMITRAEYWRETNAGVFGPRNRETRVTLVGLDPKSPLLDLPLLRGRWLNDDGNGVVINQHVLAEEPTLRIGLPIVLRVGDRTLTRNVAGVVEEMIPHLAVYTAGAATAETGSMRIVTRQHDAKSQLAAARDLEVALRRNGIGVIQMQSLADSRKALEDHLVIIKSALVLAAALVVLVGALGLTSTLTLNVVERTRELGILSAIGATPRIISCNVVFEGVFIGILSWGAAIIGAVPATLFVGGVAGRMFHKAPLDFFMSPRAVFTWFGLVVILGSLSSFYPARRAIRLSVREALTYE
jgi:putative ABC transport system permease protein